MAYENDVLTRNENDELAVRTVSATEGSNASSYDDVYTRDTNGKLAVRVVGESGGGGSVDYNRVVEKIATIPSADSSTVGKVYMYMGETNSTYTHGYIYECVATQEATDVSFSGSVVSSWAVADFVSYLQEGGANYDEVTHGTLTYDASGGLWDLVGYDENGIEVLNFHEYTEDLEDFGCVFASETHQDGDSCQFTLTTEQSGKKWKRLDVQPNNGGGGGGSDPHNLGWYATESALTTAHPTANDGDWAIVGSTDTVWVWDSDTTAWKDTDQKGQVTSVNGKTGAVVLNAEDVGAVPQYSSMPQPNQEGDIVQYIGTTNQNYTNGYFYQSVATGEEITDGECDVDIETFQGGNDDEDLPPPTFDLDFSVLESYLASRNKPQITSPIVNIIVEYGPQSTYVVWLNYNIDDDQGTNESVNVVTSGDAISDIVSGFATLGFTVDLTGFTWLGVVDMTLPTEDVVDWVQKDVQPAGSIGGVSSVNGKTGAVILTSADVGAISQYSSMPTADSTNAGEIVQFTGETGATYTNGFFYKNLQTTNPAATISQTSGSGFTSLAIDVDYFVEHQQPTGDETIDLTVIGVDEPELVSTSTITGNLEFEVDPVAFNTFIEGLYNGTPFETATVNLTYDGGNWAVTSGNIKLWMPGATPTEMGYSSIESLASVGITVTGGSVTQGTEIQVELYGTFVFIEIGDLTDYGVIWKGNPEVDSVVTIDYTESSTTYAWTRVDVQPTSETLPDQTGNAGKFLITNGTEASWATVTTTTSTTATLVVANWSSNTQTLTVNGVTSSNVVIVSPQPLSAGDYASAGVLCMAQNTNSLTFTCTQTPSNAIDLSIVIIG